MLRITLTLSLLLALIFTHNAQNIDSLKKELNRANHDTTKCNILIALIEAESDDAIWPNFNNQLILICENRIKTTNRNQPEYRIYQKHYASALNNIGYLAQIQGNIPKALQYFEKSLKIENEFGNRKELASSLNNIGNIYDNQGDIPKALEYYGKSLKIAEEIGDKSDIASSLNDIGSVYENQGNTPKALEFYIKSFKLREEIGEKKGIASSLNNIGFIYKNLGDVQKALDHYYKSLKLREEIGDKKDIAMSLNNIGFVFFDKGDIQKALEHYEKSLRIREQIGDKKGIANSMNNIGYVYHKLGDLPKTIDFYSRSLKIREEIGDKEGIASSLINIGTIQLKQKKHSEALTCFSKSMKLSKELGYPQNIMNAAWKLKQIYEVTNNFQLALENYELYIKMRDSLNNIESQKATIKQQAKHEYEKEKVKEDEKHASQIKLQKEKSIAEKRRQNSIILSVSVVLLLVIIFSTLLYARFKIIKKQKNIIEKKEKETQEQKDVIEEKQKEILDSINYAKRIQYTLLAHDEFLKENLNDHFTFFNPKDVVSGDFYWASKQGNRFYLAVCDSTGHGVPGAFMSLLNIGFLSEAINEKGIQKPNEVFEFVRMKLTETVSREGQKDGFDGILLCMDKANGIITYAAANNSPVVIREEQILELESDRMPVGVGERKENFKLYNLEYQQGDMLYLYTDGYADQFGGPKGKKFKYKPLNELLLSQYQNGLVSQHEEIKKVFENWKGNLEQVDDVCLLGIRL